MIAVLCFLLGLAAVPLWRISRALNGWVRGRWNRRETCDQQPLLRTLMRATADYMPPITETEYMIGNGWLPAPTIRDESAWEHPELSRVARNYTKGSDPFEEGSVRWPKSVAVAIQIVREREDEELLASSAWWLSAMVDAAAESIFLVTRKP